MIIVIWFGIFVDNQNSTKPWLRHCWGLWKHDRVELVCTI